MNRSRFSGEQVIGTLREQEAGVATEILPDYTVPPHGLIDWSSLVRAGSHECPLLARTAEATSGTVAIAPTNSGRQPVTHKLLDRRIY
jgi:hypothetical protein